MKPSSRIAIGACGAKGAVHRCRSTKCGNSASSANQSEPSTAGEALLDYATPVPPMPLICKQETSIMDGGTRYALTRQLLGGVKGVAPKMRAELRRVIPRQ